jgi:epoxyqueuosine reductase
MSLAQQIKQKALDLGFDLVGITDAWPIEAKQVELLSEWLKAGYAGQMSYMHRNFQKRINPVKLLEGAQSVICVGLNYTLPKRSPSLRALPSNARQSHLQHTTDLTGRVATYAQYEDYHSFIKQRLRKLTEFIISIADEDVSFKICVDSAPLAERALAARAGLGFIGKNHMLINPKIGPQIFLGEIVTTLKLQADEPIFCHSERSEESIEPVTVNCSGCNKCTEACPTGALRADGQFDANKCISYLTIEYKGEIPEELAEKIGERLFGCDECVLACPYKESAPVCKNKQFKFYTDRAELDLREILSRSRPACLPYNFEARFADSPIKRLGLDRLKRNAQICLANVAERSGYGARKVSDSQEGVSQP